MNISLLDSGVNMKIKYIGVRKLLKTLLKGKYIAYRIQLPPQTLRVLGNSKVHIYVVDEVVVLASSEKKFTKFLMSCTCYSDKIPGIPEEVYEYILKYKKNKKGAKWIQRNVKRIYDIDIPAEYIRTIRLKR